MENLELTSWDAVPIEEVADGMKRQIITGKNMTVARMYFDHDFVVPLHAHENEQITQVIEGTMRFWFGEDKSVTRDVGPGEVVVIPSNLHHGAQMIGDVIEIDMWSPRREDWLNKTDSYLRGGTAGQLSGTIGKD